MKLGFLGAGKMATAIAEGLIVNQVWDRQDMVAVDPVPEARDAFTAKLKVASGNNAAAMLEYVDLVLIAVKPQKAADALAPLAGKFGNKLVVSIAAGIPLSRLAEWVGHDRVVRTMPNTPVTIGKGATVFCCGDGVNKQDRQVVRRIFGAVGFVAELTEDKMDAVTALSGSGPAYIFELIEAMVRGGEAVGLSRELAIELTLQTIQGAVGMVGHKLGTPEELRDAVTSPGGTTEAGLRVLKSGGFRQLIADVIRVARDRSVELGQE
jgi:pyrroline-5-carboxylate reductase